MPEITISKLIKEENRTQINNDLMSLTNLTKKRINIQILMLFITLSSYGQLFLKCSYTPITIPIGDYFVHSYSIATEYKKNQIGIEYLYNKKQLLGDCFASYIKHQISLKYYLKNKEGSFKLYASPLFNLIKMEYSDDGDTLNGISEEGNGRGYGLSLGIMKEFGKHFGVEMAPYYYFLKYYSGKKYNSAESYVYYIPSSRYIFDIRILLYFRINVN